MKKDNGKMEIGSSLDKVKCRLFYKQFKAFFFSHECLLFKLQPKKLIGSLFFPLAVTKRTRTWCRDLPHAQYNLRLKHSAGRQHWGGIE